MGEGGGGEGERMGWNEGCVCVGGGAELYQICFWPPSEKDAIVKGKNLLPKRAKSFLLE